MSLYPIFTNLTDRQVLLVGGGGVAQRKAEALINANAKINLVAKEITPQLQQWIDEKKINYQGSFFEVSLLKTVFLVIAATNNPNLNQDIYEASEQSNKFCNVVDDLEHCSFVLPAIIDRSPIQVAISSAGTSPVLARLWRKKIELFLPRHLGKLALIAGQYRSLIKEKIKVISERRRFWEYLFDSQFDHLIACQKENEAKELLFTQIEKHTHLVKGEVKLVGAGPGDAGLLTIKALQAIQDADVVLYDALVSQDIVSMIRKDAEKILVGKRAHNHHVKQELTNALLIKLAKEGKRVVRLKGGDPFVFGRGAEECQEFVAQQIPFQVIPGITAAIGATAYAGIPLTHRDYSQTAIFITGHCRNDDDHLHWESLAQSKQTLAIYMGTIKSASISQELIRHGRLKETPVAVISQGTCQSQSVKIGRLENLESLAQSVPTPALIVIGEVVKLHHEITWFQ